ncbi:MAG TPA: EamA family transporter RarD [Mycobacteriales bacterium]|nr:EamA family transporter RarD [Mycobacteriales bacterium]
MQRQGLGFGILAYALWGLFPLYWPLLEPAGALEILAFRVVMSAVSVLLLLAAGRRLSGVTRLGSLALRRLTIAGVVIGINWGTYIYGVNNHHVVETSLGYFVNPLVTVGLGVLVLGERLRRVQWVALAFGVLAVVIITIDYGHPPWIALILAVSFGSYGLVKKQVGVAAPEGLLVESLVLVLPAVVLLAVLGSSGRGSFVHANTGHELLLASTGLVTVIPLLFFAGAASRLPLSSLGLLQYLAPVLQLIVGIGVRHEPLPPARLAGFALVWLALVILTVDGVRHRGNRGARPADPSRTPGAADPSRAPGAAEPISGEPVPSG